MVLRLEGWSSRRGARRCALLLACAGLSLTLGVSALFAGSAPSFTGPKDYATGSFPFSVAMAT
jgi:hypothetical protein